MSQIQKLKTGHTVEPVSNKDVERIRKVITKVDGLVRLQPGGWLVSDKIPRLINKIYDFEVSILIYINSTFALLSILEFNL